MSQVLKLRAAFGRLFVFESDLTPSISKQARESRRRQLGVMHRVLDRFMAKIGHPAVILLVTGVP